MKIFCPTSSLFASTFAFTVIFEHGPSNFAANAKKEYETMSKLSGGKVEKKADGSDSLPR